MLSEVSPFGARAKNWTGNLAMRQAGALNTQVLS